MRFLIPATLAAFAFFNHASALERAPVETYECLALSELQQFFDIAEMDATVYIGGELILATASTGVHFLWFLDPETQMYCIDSAVGGDPV